MAEAQKGGLKPNKGQEGAMKSFEAQDRQMGWLLPLIMQAITPQPGVQNPQQQPMGQTAVPMPQVPMPQSPAMPGMPIMPGAVPMQPMPGTEVFNHRMATNGPMADANAQNTTRPLNNSPWPDMSGMGSPGGGGGSAPKEGGAGGGDKANMLETILAIISKIGGG